MNTRASNGKLIHAPLKRLIVLAATLLVTSCQTVNAPVAPGPAPALQQEITLYPLYQACAAYWNSNDWPALPAHKALIAGGDDQGAGCWGETGATTVKVAEAEARKACGEHYSLHDCYAFAFDDSLDPWVQKLIDTRSSITRNGTEYPYLTCSEPDWWPVFYLSRGAPSAMAASMQGTQTGCYIRDGATYREAASNALRDCAMLRNKQCDLFAIGDQLSIAWLRIGDQLRGKMRSGEQYLALACTNPMVEELYVARKKHKAVAIGIGAESDHTFCYWTAGAKSAREASAAVLADCTKDAENICVLLAGDAHLAPWATHDLPGIDRRFQPNGTKASAPVDPYELAVISTKLPASLPPQPLGSSQEALHMDRADPATTRPLYTYQYSDREATVTPPSMSFSRQIVQDIGSSVLALLYDQLYGLQPHDPRSAKAAQHGCIDLQGADCVAIRSAADGQ